MTDRIFCHSGPIFALLPLTDPENQNFENMKNTPEDIIILQMAIILYMVPEIWSMTNIIFCHYGQFFAFLPP